VAATVILRTIAELPGLREWVVMVQREVGERFAAAPGTGAYGVPSVLAQLACEVKVLRAVSRTVFRPVPHVDSVLLGLRRTSSAAPPEVSRLVHAAFAHRRKALAGSLALAGPDGGFGPGVRDRARVALAELGHPPDERAERLAPAEFARLARLIAA
jgi:16S rRNA (adenine1518-N6/adenine1519-N6)-dimethyltransferase